MAQLKAEARGRRVPLRQVVNERLRQALSGPTEGPPKRFQVRVYDSRLRPGFDPTGLNKLADELEVDAFLETLSKAQ